MCVFVSPSIHCCCWLACRALIYFRWRNSVFYSTMAWNCLEQIKQLKIIYLQSHESVSQGLGAILIIENLRTLRHGSSMSVFSVCIGSSATHCAFSSNLFHGQIAQIYIDQLSDPENKKCSPWKVFGINHPQTPRLLSRRGPRSPEARLPQHYIGPKMTFQHFSNYNLQSCRKMCRNFFVKPGNFFLQKFAGFEGGLFQKLFKGYIFCFLGHLVGG